MASAPDAEIIAANSERPTVQKFASESLKEDDGTWKPNTALGGIGPVMGGKLKDAGCPFAYSVLSVFLSLDMDYAKFITWCTEAGVEEQYAKQAYTSLHLYIENHL